MNLWAASHNSTYMQLSFSYYFRAFAQMLKDTLQFYSQWQMSTFPFRMCVGCQINTGLHTKISLLGIRLGPKNIFHSINHLKLRGAKSHEVPMIHPILVHAAITEYHRLRGLNNEHLFLNSSGGWGSPRSRHLQIQCLVRTYFLVYRWPSFRCVLIWWKEGREFSGVSFIKTLIPFMGAPFLWTNHLPND